MTNLSKSLEDVLDMLLAKYGSPSPAAVAEVSRKHPEHRTSLLEFAAAWAEESHLSVPEGMPARVETDVARRAKAFLARELDMRMPAVAPKDKASLAELAALTGRSLKEIAAATRVDLRVLMKLDSGRIRPETIGTVLPERIARFLGMDVGVITASWSGQGSLVPAFLPSAPVQESLADALAASDTDPAEIEALLKA